METTIWVIYLTLFAISLITILFLLLSGGIGSLGVSQLIYFAIVYFTLALAVAVRAVPRILLPLFFIALPPLGWGLAALQRRTDQQLEGHLLREELHQAETFLTEHPEDLFPLRQMAGLYEKIGDLPLAAACYEAMAQALEKNPVEQDQVIHPLKRIRGMMQRPRELGFHKGSGLKACYQCGEINAQKAAECLRCHHIFEAHSVAMQIRHALQMFTEPVFFSVASAGAVALVFRENCGAVAFRWLWVILAFALWLFRRGQ